MKRMLALLLCALLAGCAGGDQQKSSPSADPGTEEVTAIALSDSGVSVNGETASTDPAADVYIGGEIIYYHDGTDATYGEGETEDAHSADEAAGHTLVTITRPGTYRLTGALSHGQIAVDLGQDAKDDPQAVVTLILDSVDVTCTVAPALIFYNVYECDRAWVSHQNGEGDYQPTTDVDTSAAGANILLPDGSVNTFTGSHVARIYQPGTTDNLYRFDGAVYSCMSMNVNSDGEDGSGVLNIIADNEGLDTELHLTINGGVINIQSQDDGINTNEDNVSVTTINGGTLTVSAGNGVEGDGIDSNGSIVINGGTVFSVSSDRAPDGGLDADGDILINGGTVCAFGVRNDAASRNSRQTYLEYTFSTPLTEGAAIELKDGEGNLLWSGAATGAYQSLTLSTPDLTADGTYALYVDDQLQEQGDGFDFGGHGGRPGGPMGGHPGKDGQTPPDLPEEFDPSQFDAQRPERPEGEDPGQFDGQRPQRPEGQRGPGGPGRGQGGEEALGSPAPEV